MYIYDPKKIVEHVYIRGISDLADSRKNGIQALTNAAMRRLAMQSATLFVAVLLRSHILAPQGFVDLVEEYIAAADDGKKIRKRKKALKKQLKQHAENHPLQAEQGFRDERGKGRVYWHTTHVTEPYSREFLRRIDSSEPKTVPEEVDEIDQLRLQQRKVYPKAEGSVTGTFSHLSSKLCGWFRCTSTVRLHRPRFGSSSIGNYRIGG